MLDPDRSLPGMISTQCGLHPRVHEAPSRSKHACRSFPDCRILKRATSGHSTRRNKRAAARSQRSREGQGSPANKSQSWWNGKTRCRYAVPTLALRRPRSLPKRRRRVDFRGLRGSNGCSCKRAASKSSRSTCASLSDPVSTSTRSIE